MTAAYHTVNFDCEVPLSFDTLFYVESAENEQLNQLMLGLYADVQNNSRRLRTAPQPFSLHFRYVTQKEVATDNLASGLQRMGYSEEDTLEFTELLQTGLSTETGGVLALRLAPRYDDFGPVWDETTLLATDSLQCTTPDAAWRTLQQFANDAARENFLHLTGMTYEAYLRKKRSTDTSLYSAPPGYMGFMTVKPDTSPVDEELDQRARELIELASRNFPGRDISILLQRSNTLLENSKKIKQVCKLEVLDKGDISFRGPDGKKRNCNFERGAVGRSLYILFLRQIERFSKGDSKTPCIDRNHLNRYHDELVMIYKIITERTCRDKTEGELKDTIERLWRNPTNTISHINAFFEDIFDVEALGSKHYTIEKVSEDDDLWSIGLDINDFDMGAYSIGKLKSR